MQSTRHELSYEETLVRVLCGCYQAMMKEMGGRKGSKTFDCIGR